MKNPKTGLFENTEGTTRRLAGYLLAVQDLHAERHRTVEGHTLRWCRECGQDWPCPTQSATRGFDEQH